MGIITAHFEGGDVTEGGTFDDSVRRHDKPYLHLRRIKMLQNAHCIGELKKMYSQLASPLLILLKMVNLVTKVN